MAGHSKFKNIMHRKGAQDAKRARVFTKVGREITVAAKLGAPEPEKNPRLRAAIAAARAVNMPKDRIEKAIAKGSGADADATNFDEMRYEGYGVGGVAVIVEALTDNRNRTAAEVRSIFNKHAGTLGETNSVAFSFEQVGRLVLPTARYEADAVFEAGLEAGAEDVQSSEEEHEIICATDDFAQVRDALESSFETPSEARLVWRPLNVVAIDESNARTLLKMIDTLEDNDDVQQVYTNADISDNIMEKLAAE